MKRTAVSIQRLKTCVFMATLFLAGNNIWATTHIVQFGGNAGFTYVPASFSAVVGDTVKWMGDFTMHPLSSTTIPTNSQSWHVTSGTSFSYIIALPGTYHYQCDLHHALGMTGSFVATSSSVLYHASLLNPGPGNQMEIISTMTSGKPFVKFTVTHAGPVTLQIFDLYGRESATVIDRIMEEGTYSIALITKMKAEGFYCVSFTGNNSACSRVVYFP
jgi:plastocyanin